MTKWIKYIFIMIWCLVWLVLPKSAEAVVNPLESPNNRFGIHIIQATPDESSPAAQLVNSSGGDWGYITVLMERKDKNKGKWQTFFNDLRRRHLIPIVRLATEPDKGNWKRPDEGEEEAWADFLHSLNWPTKNRYVVIYNEPNHGQEWGGQTDPRSYAQVLNKTIDALKKRSEDFYVINAGLDAATPHRPPNYFDAVTFMQQMDDEVPGIFNKLDGWSSHSYPNPGFVGSPNGVGRTTVRGWYAEVQTLRGLGVTKYLPIFITETGWKHSDGLTFDPSLPTPETVAEYYQEAFTNAWNFERIVAVTPFLLSYQETPFDHFSFKKIGGKDQGYYPHYQAVAELPKIGGNPVQINSFKLEKGEVYTSIVSGESYSIPITVKNTGQSIWGDGNKVELRIQNEELKMNETVGLPVGSLIEPDQMVEFKAPLRAPRSGTFRITLQLYRDGKPFDSTPLEFTTQVKSPVVLKVKSGMNWQDDPSGDYTLSVSSPTGLVIQNLKLSQTGESDELEVRHLLPDYEFEFTLSKPFYHSKTVRMRVVSGANTLDFDKLQPNLIELVLNPKELWNQLTFSN